MHLADIIVTLVILAILGAAIAYIYHAKKNGAKCIGCPAAGKCPSHQGGACSCHSAAQTPQESTEIDASCDICAPDAQTDA